MKGLCCHCTNHMLCNILKGKVSLFNFIWWPNGRASDSGARGRGFNPRSGRCVVSLSKIHLPPKSTGNTQEAVAPFQHD